MLESIGAELDERNAVALAEPDAVSRLRGLVDALLGLQRDRPASLLIIAREFLDRSGRIEAAESLPLAGTVRDTVAAIEDGQRAGSVRDGDPVALTAAFHGALLNGVLARTVYERTADRSADAWDESIVAASLALVLVEGRSGTGVVGGGPGVVLG